ncbi:MAG: hypothetical protein K2W95_10370 [Candidatus Obscuribacterales bacterium]|nr:hypothetical protein [Candidatus Obscuribacterales bacterium]
MVFDSPDGEQLKILDFGIAKVTSVTRSMKESPIPVPLSAAPLI